MDERPFISIIMPVYNAERYLTAAVQSVLGQGFRDLELICVNDCSTDNSLSVLQTLAAGDSRLQIVSAEKNGGPGAARNLGLACARGVYIGFADTDDAFAPRLLEQVVPRLLENNADEIVWGLTEIYFAGDGTEKKRNDVIPADGMYCGDRIPAAVAQLEEQTLFGYQWNSLYRASILNTYQIRFNTDTLYEDFTFNIDFIAHAQTLCVCGISGYHYVRHAGSVTHGFIPDYYVLSEKRIARMTEYLEQNGALTRENASILANRLLRYMLSALGRNASRAAKLSVREQKKRVEQMKTSPLTKRLLYDPSVTISKTYRPAAFVIKSCPAFAALLTGKAVALVYR